VLLVFLFLGPAAPAVADNNTLVRVAQPSVDQYNIYNTT
jgi:hypothetical protein